MSSKMREALKEQEERMRKGEAAPGFPYSRDSTARTALNLAAREINEIISRYGDLEFTREEVRGMLEEAMDFAFRESDWCSVKGIPQDQWNPDNYIEEILSRHLGEGESGVPKQWAKVESEHGITNVALLADDDETPTIKASEIERVTGDTLPRWAELAFFINGELKIAGEGASYKTDYRGDPEAGDLSRLFRMNAERRIIHDDKEHTLDREVGELQGELILLTKRVAAIERRVLADGHSRNCRMMGPRFSPPECTCGYDEIRDLKNA